MTALLATVDASPLVDPRAGGHAAAPIPSPAMVVSDPRVITRVGEWDAATIELVSLAESLNDLELTRIAMENRRRSLAAEGAGARELGTLDALVGQMAAVEHQAILAVQRAMRAHPLGPWVKRSKGVGEKQAARLIASIGNPYWNTAADRPRRGPAELWAYCGYHVISRPGQDLADTRGIRPGAGTPLPADQPRYDTHGPGVGGQPLHPHDHVAADAHVASVVGVAARRRKGAQSNWNNTARMRARLVAESCIKQMDGTYRPIYDHGRAKYAHLDLPDGHKHARALRLVAKAVLKDMWIEARDWHHQ